jgi:hypothetical protein
MRLGHIYTIFIFYPGQSVSFIFSVHSLNPGTLFQRGDTFLESAIEELDITSD